MAMPTTPIVAPAIAALGPDDAFAKANMLALRNPSVINMIDGCSISLPMHQKGKAPTGLMLAATSGRDADLFAIAAAAEGVLDG